jgi:hypothetical protein
VNGNGGLFYFAGIGARAVEERSAGAAGAVDQILGQRLEIFAVVIILFADHVDQPRPAATDADYFAALAQGTDGYSADGGVQAGHIAAAGKDSDHTFFCFHFVPRNAIEGSSIAVASIEQSVIGVMRRCDP